MLTVAALSREGDRRAAFVRVGEDRVDRVRRLSRFVGHGAVYVAGLVRTCPRDAVEANVAVGVILE